MNREELFGNIMKKRSYLCVGLDSDITKIPRHLMQHEDPVFEFNRRIIDATAPYAVAFKPNLAFYECNGAAGWASLSATIAYLRENHPDCFIIADAKRGDIGNTSAMYAQALFKGLGADAVTVAPYMGEDSVSPFLGYEGRWVALLALTSNRGADDFQYHTEGGERLFEKVLRQSKGWGTEENMMYVVGATRAEMLADVRKIVPLHFLLVPGIGAQGGSLREVSSYGMNEKCGLLVNSSRAIIFADGGDRFDKVAADKAAEVQSEMSRYLP